MLDATLAEGGAAVVRVPLGDVVRHGGKLKRLTATIPAAEPFTPNMAQLAGKIQASRNSTKAYLGRMEKAGMIAPLRIDGACARLAGRERRT